MYPQNNIGAGAQWTFATIIVIVVLALTLGILVSNSEWLQPQIAQAAADGINKDNDIEYQKGLVDLERYRNAALREDEREKLALENQKEANRQVARFQQGFYETLNTGFFAILLAVSLVIVTWGVTNSLKSYKLALLQAETKPNHQTSSQTIRICRQPSAAAMRARERERKQRLNNLAFKHTRPFWPDNGKNEQRIQDLPWAN